MWIKWWYLKQKSGLCRIQKKKKKGKKRGKKATVMHFGLRQSGLRGQLYLTVVLETTNGAFINCKSRGCSEAVQSAHEMMSSRLGCCSTVVKKGLNSVRETGGPFSCGKVVSKRI